MPGTFSLVSLYWGDTILTALKYVNGESAATDEKFFGSWRQSEKSDLKEFQRKQH